MRSCHRRAAVTAAAGYFVLAVGITAAVTARSHPRTAQRAGRGRAAAHLAADATFQARMPGTGPVAGANAAARVGLSRVGTPVDPARFRAGSCRMFPAALGSPEHGQTVFLDAGHGGIDPGGTGHTETGRLVEESRVNLAVELDAMRMLTKAGYRVTVSRTRHTTVTVLKPGYVHDGLLTARGVFADVAARDICANQAGAGLLVGIYMDAGWWGLGGSLTGYDAARSFAARNRRFAGLLQHDVLSALNRHGYRIPDDGVLADRGLGSSVSAAGGRYGHLLLLGPAKRGYFSTPSRMPGALIEPLYLTDPFEGSLAASPRGQRLIADGIAQAVSQYFSS